MLSRQGPFFLTTQGCVMAFSSSFGLVIRDGSPPVLQPPLHMPDYLFTKYSNLNSLVYIGDTTFAYAGFFTACCLLPRHHSFILFLPTSVWSNFDDFFHLVLHLQAQILILWYHCIRVITHNHAYMWTITCRYTHSCQSIHWEISFQSQTMIEMWLLWFISIDYSYTLIWD